MSTDPHVAKTLNNLPVLQTDDLITVTPGTITFDDTELVEQALFIAEKLKSMEVTEDNLKDAKKVVARVSKAVKELEQERISAKKKVLEPYDTLEKRVKRIVTIVKDAETRIRDITKTFDEAERRKKEKEVEALFSTLRDKYNLKIINFHKFLQPHHLNKSQSMKKNHDEIVEFFEQIKKDIAVIDRFDDHSTEVLTEYIKTLDLSKSIETVEERHEIKETIENSQITEPQESMVAFIIPSGQVNFTKLLLETNNIPFEIKHL